MPQTFSLKNCRRCKAEFKPSGANARWCSDACKNGTAVCRNCQKTFTASRKSKGIYCCISCHYEHRVPFGTVRAHDNGYTIIKVPKGTVGANASGSRRTYWMHTHRYVMQQKLGRPLLSTEKVHHINGRRDDNRPENLELWKRAHPAGVRAADYHCAGCRCHEQGFFCE